jgi:hypothetical protein
MGSNAGAELKRSKPELDSTDRAEETDTAVH